MPDLSSLLPDPVVANLPFAESEASQEGEGERPILWRVVKEYAALAKKASPSVDYCATSYLSTVMEAAAEMSAQLQEAHFKQVYNYIESMVRAGSLKGTLLTWHQVYDETPLRLRLHAMGGSSGGPCHAEVSDTVLAKVFVIETSWSMLCEGLGMTDKNLPSS